MDIKEVRIEIKTAPAPSTSAPADNLIPVSTAQRRYYFCMCVVFQCLTFWAGILVPRTSSEIVSCKFTDSSITYPQIFGDVGTYSVSYNAICENILVQGSYETGYVGDLIEFRLDDLSISAFRQGIAFSITNDALLQKVSVIIFLVVGLGFYAVYIFLAAGKITMPISFDYVGMIVAIVCGLSLILISTTDHLVLNAKG
jgi:hypothetical protein